MIIPYDQCYIFASCHNWFIKFQLVQKHTELVELDGEMILGCYFVGLRMMGIHSL